MLNLQWTEYKKQRDTLKETGTSYPSNQKETTENCGKHNEERRHRECNTQSAH